MSIETRLHAVEEYLKTLKSRVDQGYYLIDKKVSKTGDTMTGSLKFDGYGDGEVGLFVNNDGTLTWDGERIVTNDGWYSSISYTSSTSYEGRGNIAIPTNGLYRVRASYSNSAVLTLGYGGENNTNPAATIILMDASFGGSLEVVTYIPAGTYKFWAKCGSNGATNNIALYRIMTLA